MKLEYPLSDLVKNCQTVCEPACCGERAYDFSPIHVASFLIRSSGKVKLHEVETIKSQISALLLDYGPVGAKEVGIRIEQMYQEFSGQGISKLSSTLLTSLEQAAELAIMVERQTASH